MFLYFICDGINRPLRSIGNVIRGQGSDMVIGKSVLFGILSFGLTLPALADVNLNTRYQATIWVDPDGCQHWVMDTGMEGYMSLRLDRAGKPVCNQPVDIACKDPSKHSMLLKGQAKCK